MYSRLKDNLKLISINLSTFLGLALLVEFGIFLLLQHPSYIPSLLMKPFRAYYAHQDRSIIQVTDCARYDTGLFYLLRPGSCTFENREFQVNVNVNSLGLRDDEVSLENPEIICLGDSYTMGWGIEQDESFPHLLEKMTSRKILNAGMSSFGTARELTLLRRLDLDSVKYVVIQYHANDDAENSTFLRLGRLPIRTKQSYDSLVGAIDARNDYFIFKHLYGITKGVGKQLRSGHDATAYTAAEAQNFLEVLKRAKIDNDIKIIIFKLDDHTKTADQFPVKIDSLLRGPDYRSLNVNTFSISAELTESDYFILDEHINANGHRKIAAKIQHHFFND